MTDLLEFYRGKRVLITGHTGFKGSWLTKILLGAGAAVSGFSLEPPTTPALFTELQLSGLLGERSVTGDIRDLAALSGVFRACEPEIVFHLAAQPIVRESYRNPVLTYGTNVLGTVHVLECIRLTDSVRSFLNVTTDKVYDNLEERRGYQETDRLDGFDPYSNSKSCSELVTHSYVRSFFQKRDVAVSTARAGNVIGGGDYAPDRILPDCIRAAEAGVPVKVRNPYSVRPYQHVLEPLFVYLMIARAQYEDPSLAGSYNVGPDLSGCLSTGKLAELFCSFWGGGQSWESLSEAGPHEAGLLMLDNAKLKRSFGWKPVWTAETAVKKAVEFAKSSDRIACAEEEIREFSEAFSCLNR